MTVSTAPITYRISRRPMGLYFVCIACGHEVDVNGFPLLRGPGLSRRTLAAADMAKHQDQAHKKPYHYCSGPQCEFCRQQRAMSE